MMKQKAMIRPCEDRDIESLIALNLIEWQSVLLDTYPLLFNYLMYSIGAGNICVAESDEKVVGYSTWTFFDDALGEELFLGYKENLSLAGNPKERPAIERQLSEYKEQYEIDAPIIVEFHNPDLAKTLSMEPSDMYISDIVVDKGHRGCGIGKLLAEASLRPAEESGSNSVYLHALSGTPSQRLYESCGFVPILTRGPSYPDGKAGTLMVKVL